MRKKQLKVFVGFDGFIDSLFHCVKKRMDSNTFQRINSISEFSELIQNAASQSTNVECVLQEKTLGGNAPLLAQALASLAQDVSLVGCCGKNNLDPVFQPLKEYGCHVISFAEAGETHALEFKDGKLLLGNMNELGTITLSKLLSFLPSTLLSDLVYEAFIIATVNWTMMPLVSEFWDWLISHPELLRADRKKILFVDFADPKKRTSQDLLQSIHQLCSLQKHMRVILGLNRSESQQVCHALGIATTSSLEETAQKILSSMQVDTVVIHSHEIVAAASTESVTIPVPYCENPRRSTGAGDVFNAGFLYGLLQNKSIIDCLKAALASSGVWVRTGKPPTTTQAEGSFGK